jgi:tetratricopeptide (TPR) repeat protein
MINRIKCCLFGVFIALLFFSNLPPLRAVEETAQTYYQQALGRINEGDSTGALNLLDKALEIDPKLWDARLARGRIHLAAGDLDAARNDFNRALSSKSPEIKAKAHIGLGDIYFSMGKRTMQAITEYRLALRADPSSCEAYFALFQAGWEVGIGKGYRIASEALVKLICLDPCFRDAYKVWRDTILDKTEDELRSACTCLERYVAENTEKSTWLFDLAGYRYWLEEIDKALENLARLEQACPEYKIPERLLLRARCLLELEEISGFERSYYDAINAAEKTGDFHRLVIQAETIFNPAESRKAGECQSAQDWAVFFRKFWKRRDPDPLTFHNERLVEHYRRLRKAEKFYPVFNPYPSRFNTSRDYYRLISMKLGASPRETGPSNYDPDLFWNRSRELGLDQRGLLYVRHGPPDEIRLPEPPASGPPPSAEVWRYGPAFFPFEKVFGASGEYLFIPLYIRGVGNVEKAMETESFRDPLSAVEQEGYWTYFKGPGKQLEVEFYQSAPVETAPKAPDPKASLALYDSTWTELARDNSISARIKIPSGKNWIAVNRANSMPGHYFFALRMDIPDHRAVMRESMVLETFVDDALDLSGVILGSPPKKGQQLHSRRGVNILPRPSLQFITDEIITVYFEVYGLEGAPDSRRSYLERVTISLIKEDKSKLTSMLDVINPWGKKRSASLSLTFHRNPPGSTGVVAEHFTIDPSELVPGSYNLLIQVLDNNSRQVALTGCFFDLTKKK